MVQIAVLGASGHTGRFVVDELHRRGLGVIRAVRSGSSPTTNETRMIAFDRPDSLDEALRGAAAVINCAGPFFDTSEPAAAAAIRARIPYLDVTAEQVTALRLFEVFDAQARSAGITFVPAMAFYGGLADLLASALVREGEAVDTIHAAVALDGWQPTAGTRLTGERNHYQRLMVRDGQLAPLDVAPESRRWNFPEPFGQQQVVPLALAEVVLMHRHLHVREQISFMNETPLADLRDPSTPAPTATDERGRSAQQFVMDVEVRVGAEVRRATASGQDIYAITAPLVVSACVELLGNPALPTGVRSPGELFEPVAFLNSLAPDLATTFSVEV
ncbi:MAG TPA: saccharopine dehydrogenase NADP-binding domain-containing protein [Sphingomicrobium sp.]